MLGFLLARAGVHVLILEKHRDFLRDFRGDTIHPSTLEVMHELGLLPQLLQLPHQEAREIGAQIGDAAHAMSPIGGVGINLAIQDAVATANYISEALRKGTLNVDRLKAVQRRRELPTRVMQRFQVVIQKRVISRVLGRIGELDPPFAVRMLTRFSILQRIPARLIGIGIRPERVTTRAAAVSAQPQESADLGSAR